VGFDIEVDEFSGPLDLLCKLIETGQIEASKIRVSDLIATYAAYLSVEKAMPIGRVSEFISLTARLLLVKVKRLFPKGAAALPDQETFNPQDDFADEALRAAIQRYRPFRNASRILAERLASRQRIFLRQSKEDEQPLYDFGDLYSLARLWWDLILEKSTTGPERVLGPSEEMLGFEPGEPDTAQVERRMEEIVSYLRGKGPVLFGTILGQRAGRGAIIVSLLALLELARLGVLRLQQEGSFGELRFEIS